MLFLYGFVPEVLLVRRAISSRSALVRKVETVLLRLGFELRCQTLRSAVVRSINHIARVTQVRRQQLALVIESGEYGCA